MLYLLFTTVDDGSIVSEKETCHGRSKREERDTPTRTCRADFYLISNCAHGWELYHICRHLLPTAFCICVTSAKIPGRHRVPSASTQNHTKREGQRPRCPQPQPETAQMPKSFHPQKQHNTAIKFLLFLESPLKFHGLSLPTKSGGTSTGPMHFLP